MNIFCTSSCPTQSALWLDDVRKNKMILESAQLLSNAVRYNDPTFTGHLYKLTHNSHPCSRWARSSKSNFKWLLDHLKALCEQWGQHKTALLVPTFEEFYGTGHFKSLDPTPFVNCTASFKHEPDTHLAYRLQMNEKWNNDTIKLSWKRGEVPPWKDSL